MYNIVGLRHLNLCAIPPQWARSSSCGYSAHLMVRAVLPVGLRTCV